MTMHDMGNYNFRMGVEYMQSFKDDCDDDSIVEALGVLSEILKDLSDGEPERILASKAIDVAYTAMSGYCDDDGLDFYDYVNELKYELLRHW